MSEQDQTQPTTQNSDYQASNITVLEGLEAVRKRPGMYIGNTGKDGLHRCLGEILDYYESQVCRSHYVCSRRWPWYSYRNPPKDW
jgi:hypothetical protein